MENSSVKLGYVFYLALAAALGGLLFGYDTAVISGTIDQVSEQFQLDVIQQGWYVGCALIGSIGGVAFSGWLSDKMGRKPTMFLSAILFTVSAVGCAFTPSFYWLVFYRIVGGVGIGVVSIVAPMYISEISIAQYRGRMVSLYQLAITIGFLAAYFVNYQLLKMSQATVFVLPIFQKVYTDEVWRGMLGMETIPALFFFLLLFFVPESPRWLVVRNKSDKASNILSRVFDDSSEVQKVINQVRANMLVKAKANWQQLLRPGIFTAVVVGVCIAILGQFMGVNAVLYYGPSIFKDAGMDNPLFCQVLVGLVNTITTIIAMFIIDEVGRKKLIYYGVSGMMVSLLLTAFYFAFAARMGLSVYFMLTFFLFYVFCCAISISAVVWVLLSEMYPNNIRGIAMSVAGFALWIGTFLIGQLTPWMLHILSPSRTFVLFAVMCVPYLFIMWRYVPETAGMSLEDIERYWNKQGLQK